MGAGTAAYSSVSQPMGQNPPVGLDARLGGT
jgi:hypothetical protein